MDSMKIYRGMDVGTAKPKAEVRRRVPHHMLDLVEPDEPLTAARFGEMAREVIFEISSPGTAPPGNGGERALPARPSGLDLPRPRSQLGGPRASSLRG